MLRCGDLQMKRTQITFLVDPFNFETDCLKAPLVSDEAAPELEMIDLCEEDKLKPALREGTTEFLKSVPMENTSISNGLNLWYSQSLGQHTSASLCFYPKSRESKASICTD